MGASTRLIDACAPRLAELTSVETSQGWIGRVQPTVSSRVRFLRYERFVPQGPYDMVFVDGVAEKRLEFGRRVFPFLNIGGVMLLHDTRRLEDLKNVLALLGEFYLEVSRGTARLLRGIFCRSADVEVGEGCGGGAGVYSRHVFLPRTAAGVCRGADARRAA